MATSLGDDRFHPSELILEEMETRGWSTLDVARRMGGSAYDQQVDLLALDMYIAVGPTNPNCRLFDMAEQLGHAFDVNPQFFRNLEAAWLASKGVAP